MSKALYTDSGERTFHSPQDIQQNSPRNTIQLLAREAFDKTGIMHYYYLYTNNSGNQSYVSAFPEKLIPPNGKIIMENGAYVAGSPDFKNSIRVGEITGDSKSVADAFNNIKGEFRRIHKNYDYLPWQNSNSAAVTALFNSGIQFKRGTPTPGDFSNVNAPGQSTDLSAGKALGKENNKEDFSSMGADSLIKSVDTDKMQRNVNIFDTVNRANQISGAYPDKMQRNIDAFGSLSGMRNPLEAGFSAQQLGTPTTNNADLDKALALLNGMKQDNPESADQQNTTPEPVAVGSGKDSGMEK
jgi:hypothetical protein